MNVYEVKSIGARIAGNPYVGRASSSAARGREQGPCSPTSSWAAAPTAATPRLRAHGRRHPHRGLRPGEARRPSLIIYAHRAQFEKDIVVTNGDQTDTIVEALRQGGDMEGALETREFEPDAPNLTPRISGQLCLGCPDGKFRYKLSILKSMDEAGTACTRQYFRYVGLPGLGHFIHTYVTDGAPIPSFAGEPERVSIPDDLDTFTAELWDSLDADNRISLYVCSVDLATGVQTDRLINKFN
jgi:hypothetical protein